MKFEQFKICLLGLRASRAAQDEYLNSIPADIADAFFDNEYVNEYDKMVNTLVSSLMTSEQEDWFFYFLYEWSPGHEICVDTNTYTPDNVSEVLEFLWEELEWE
jgi:hypothetical protein